MGLVAKLAFLLSFGAVSVGWSEGYAVRYAEGRMGRTADIRGIARQPCMVAWTNAAAHDIGETWLLVEGARTGRRLRCLVVDLPEPRDRAALVRRDILVELDYDSGFRICGPQWQGKATECPVKVLWPT